MLKIKNTCCPIPPKKCSSFSGEGEGEGEGTAGSTAGEGEGEQEFLSQYPSDTYEREDGSKEWQVAPGIVARTAEPEGWSETGQKIFAETGEPEWIKEQGEKLVVDADDDWDL